MHEKIIDSHDYNKIIIDNQISKLNLFFQKIDNNIEQLEIIHSREYISNENSKTSKNKKTKRKEYLTNESKEKEDFNYNLYLDESNYSNYYKRSSSRIKNKQEKINSNKNISKSIYSEDTSIKIQNFTESRQNIKEEIRDCNNFSNKIEENIIMQDENINYIGDDNFEHEKIYNHNDFNYKNYYDLKNNLNFNKSNNKKYNIITNLIEEDKKTILKKRKLDDLEINEQKINEENFNQESIDNKNKGYISNNKKLFRKTFDSTISDDSYDSKKFLKKLIPTNLKKNFN